MDVYSELARQCLAKGTKAARFISADSIVPGAGALTLAPHDPVATASWGKAKEGGPANPQDLNRYAYVLNNPVRNTDPTGHDVWQFSISIVATAAAPVGVMSYISFGFAIDTQLNTAFTVTAPTLPTEVARIIGIDRADVSAPAPAIGIPGGGVNFSGSYNTAATIDGISGRGADVGGSVRAGPAGLGVSYTPSLNSDGSKASDGLTLSYAPGGGAELHAAHTYTQLHGRNLPQRGVQFIQDRIDEANRYLRQAAGAPD